jgi:hypothetical protein
MSLSFTVDHAMNTYEVCLWMYISMPSLARVLDGGGWLVSRLGRFARGESAPSTLRIQSWVSQGAINEKIPYYCRESSVVQTVA